MQKKSISFQSIWVLLLLNNSNGTDELWLTLRPTTRISIGDKAEKNGAEDQSSTHISLGPNVQRIIQIFIFFGIFFRNNDDFLMTNQRN